MSVKQRQLDNDTSKKVETLDQKQEQAALEELFLNVFQKQVVEPIAIQEKHDVA